MNMCVLNLVFSCRTAPGTVISGSRNMDNVTVTSIVLKNNVTLVDVVSTRMMGQYGFLATVFDCFRTHRISVDVVATSEVRHSVLSSAVLPFLPPDFTSSHEHITSQRDDVQRTRRA